MISDYASFLTYFPINPQWHQTLMSATNLHLLNVSQQALFCWSKYRCAQRILPPWKQAIMRDFVYSFQMISEPPFCWISLPLQRVGILRFLFFIFGSCMAVLVRCETDVIIE